VEVVEVAPGSPAERAGVRAEDLLVSLAGVPVDDVMEVQRLMGADRIGEPLEAVVIRGERTLTLEVVPGELSDAA
jgi:S1-C subfamily serine protease